jgi:hypothetical protein
MTAATDPRVESVGQLLTGPRLLAGHGEGLVRLTGVGRLLGVPLADRGLLLAWVEACNLWVEHPTDGPLVDHPRAGCIDLATLRQALKKALKAGPLPFRAEYIQELQQ